MEHLTCFIAGNLALGVANGAVDGAKGEQYLEVARNLTKTCFSMYSKMPTGKRSAHHFNPCDPAVRNEHAGAGERRTGRPERMQCLFRV